MRFIIGFPVVLSVVGFVLAMLALFAGNRPGFMEEYHIIMVSNTRSQNLGLHHAQGIL